MPFAFACAIAATLVFSLILRLLSRRADKGFYAREGLVCVGLSWIALSLFGSLPFVFSREIPAFIDALFETASGLSTTGASILTDVEAMSHTALIWRSLTHFIGGMGVLVFLLAILPSSGGSTINLMRAESPGPSVGKVVPKISMTARLLYAIYLGLTALELIFLIAGGMPIFDAVCTSFGTAGTGGFAVTNAGLGGYSPYIQWVTTIFMFLFGVNFSCYYLLLKKRAGSVLRDEELRFYLGVFLICGLIIAISVRPYFGSFGETLRHAMFQAASIMSTTGFATTDFDLWPTLAKGILVFLMILGASAGSACHRNRKNLRISLCSEGLCPCTPTFYCPS